MRRIQGRLALKEHTLERTCPVCKRTLDVKDNAFILIPDASSEEAPDELRTNFVAPETYVCTDCCAVIYSKVHDEFGRGTDPMTLFVAEGHELSHQLQQNILAVKGAIDLLDGDQLSVMLVGLHRARKKHTTEYAEREKEGKKEIPYQILAIDASLCFFYSLPSVITSSHPIISALYPKDGNEQESYF